MGAIYLNLQMVFRQLLSPTIEKCFMRFECYRNKAVVVETSIAVSYTHLMPMTSLDAWNGASPILNARQDHMARNEPKASPARIE